MIAALDVQYDDPTHTALAAAVVFAHWDAAASTAEYTATCSNVAPYQPGEFFRRELPCLLQILKQIRRPLDIIVIDGYVTLGDKPGLGHHLWEAVSRATPVIGVAKTRFHAAEACEVVRGASRLPLFVTASGIEATVAAEHIRSMHGEFRIPTHLKRVDQLARGAIASA
jgi:deoxyribonuclease V